MNYIHGDARKDAVTPLFSVWRAMLARCKNPRGRFYHRYGGRGIRVCEEWGTYTPFRDWSLANGYATGLTLDRIDNDLGYSPENCRFVDRKQQARNRASSAFITCNGRTATLAEWSEIVGKSQSTLWARLRKLKWTPERAFELVD